MKRPTIKVRFWRTMRVRDSGAVPILLPLSHILAAQSGFVHSQGAQLVDGQGQTLMLRGTNLGNWLVREGYMTPPR